MAQTLGVMKIVWRGVDYDVETGATYQRPGFDQKPVTTNSRKGHYAQEPVQGTCTATVPLMRGQRLSELTADGPGELQVHCDTGQIFVHPDAYRMGPPPQATGGEGGKIQMQWGFGEGEELVA